MSEGRSATSWVDYSLYGHQIVCHFAGESYTAVDYHNPVDSDDVPVPHFGGACCVVQYRQPLGHSLPSQLL